jgi:hypothetical protein
MQTGGREYIRGWELGSKQEEERRGGDPRVENFPDPPPRPVLTFSIFTKMIDFFDDHRLSA